MTDHKITTTITGGHIQGVAGAGAVHIENLNIYNRDVEKPATDEENTAIGGMWVDSNGSISQIMQTGDSFRFESLNRQTGLRSQGTGSVNGRRFNLIYQTNIPSTGTATGDVSANGLEITETVQDSVYGVFSQTARKQ